MGNRVTIKIIAIAVVITMLTCLIATYFSDYKYAKKYANIVGENPSIMLAIAKAESGFTPSAISPKGAVGLCQIMPETAKWCAGQMGIAYDKNMLLNGEYNMKMAVFYMNYLMDKFQNEELAICAYNAGEGNVSQWMNDEKTYKNGKFREIPFEETRNYLKKVKAYKQKFTIYAYIFRW